MMTHIYGRIVFECDGCIATIETGEADFEAARQVAREAGWVSKKLGAQWEHYCERCAG